MLAVVVMLSGVEYAQAQTPTFDTGAPLFLKMTDQVTHKCRIQHAGTAFFGENGLSADFTIRRSPVFKQIAYVEVTADSTDKSFAIYNYEVLSKKKIRAIIPFSALPLISDTPGDEIYTIQVIRSAIKIDGEPKRFRFIDNTAITDKSYEDFASFAPGTSGLLISSEMDTLVTQDYDSMTTSNTVSRSDPVNKNRCIASSIEIKSIPEEYAPQMAILHKLKNDDKGRGSNEDWQLNPTFGRSWGNNAQIVSGGFTFNDTSVDVTDNFHTDFDRITAKIGELNTIKVKIYTEMILEQVTLSLGVPEPSRVSDAEAEIMIKLRSDYNLPEEYKIVDIIHGQKEGLIDVYNTTSSVQKVPCMPGSERDCHEFAITFRMTAPLVYDVVAVSAIDIDRRITTTYINDGIGFEGKPLLPPLTHTTYSKKGNQHPEEVIHLTQSDRRYNVWTDQHGYVWLKNSYGSWFQLTHADFKRLQDPYVNVMTRTHSNFADLVEQEKERARQVFDSESIKSQVGESFSHDAPVRINKMNDPEILERLRVAEIAALEYLKRY
ncbi:MAG: hypothetical protein D9C04_05875 [Nitrosopumilus sp. B06]|nr:MAG: hypothetical protein D9C04_05875 [Nitrosopumilus sp. B06]